MIKCPNPECGYQNVDGTQFCEGCGEELPQNTGAASGTSTGSTAGTSASGAMIKCPACDNMNPADNVVCEVCGTDLKAGATGSTSTPAVGGGSASVAASTTSTTPFDTMTSGTATPPATTGVMPSAGAGGLSGGASVAAAAPDMSPTSVSATAAPSFAPDVSAPALTDTPASSSMPVVAVGDTTSGVGAMSSSTPVMPGSDSMSSTIPADPLAATPMSTSPMGATTDPSAGTSTDPSASVSADPASVAAAFALGGTTSGTATSGELAPGRVKLVVEQGMTVGKQFVLGDSEVQVGREDEDEKIYPDIDLSDQDEGYVHRRHATLKFENGGLTATHLGGANKTRINNRPLPDNTPEAVKIGDKLAFGKVVVRVTPN